MQRVKRSTAVAVLPSPPAGGTAGYFAQPNPHGGIPATVPGYEWYNNVQEELLAVIEGQGLVASDTDRTQLRQAISKMIQAGQRSVIINNATFAPAVAGSGQAVYWDSTNNRFDLALADGSAKQNCVGFADVANGNVYAFGDAVLFAGLTAGVRYYLSPTTAGTITTALPASNAVFVGIARTATEIFVDIDVQPLTAVHGQLLRITRYTTAGSGTWTKQSDTNSILVRAVAGGGGGGGGITGSNQAGNGGYSGCYGEKLITAPAASYSYTVGAAGSGGAVGAAGSAGGQTSFGAMTLTGGPGGQTALGALVALPTGSGWDFTSATAGCAGHADSTGNVHAAPGSGGSSPFAGGGSGSGTTTVAGSYGSGGGGGPRTSGTGYAGSNGGAGYIEVWEFA